jgi:hypothetical protein
MIIRYSVNHKPSGATTSTVQQREIIIKNIPVREKFVLAIELNKNNIDVYINGKLAATRFSPDDLTIQILKSNNVIPRPYLYFNYNESGTILNGNYADFQFFTK